MLNEETSPATRPIMVLRLRYDGESAGGAATLARRREIGGGVDVREQDSGRLPKRAYVVGRHEHCIRQRRDEMRQPQVARVQLALDVSECGTRIVRAQRLRPRGA